MDIQQLEHFFSNFQIYRLRPGNIIRLVRYSLGLSSREFAKKTGLSQTDVIRCELGQKPVPEKKLWVFLERLNKICPIKCYSSYAYTRDPFERDSHGNLAPIPGKHENFKLDIANCFQESFFREKYFKLLLSKELHSNYQGNSYDGRKVLRYLVWRTLHEIIFNHPENKGLWVNDKVIFIIAFIQGIISYEHILDENFCRNHILPQKKEIIDYLFNQMTHTYKEDFWIIDLYMLMFHSFNINFEDRFVSVSLFSDIQPPKNLVMCWESNLVFNF